VRFRSSVDEPLTFFQERRTRRVRQNIAPPRARRSTPLVSLPASVHRCCVRFHCSPPPSSSSPPSLPRVASRRSSLYSTTRGKRAGAPLSVSTGRSASRRAAPRRAAHRSTPLGTGRAPVHRSLFPLVSSVVLARSPSSVRRLAVRRRLRHPRERRVVLSLCRRWWRIVRDGKRGSSRVPVVVVVAVIVVVIIFVIVLRRRSRRVRSVPVW